MGLYLGSTDLSAADFYLGSNTVSAIYQGSNQLYPAAAAGFDPSLGGALTVGLWYDFTDSSTMTLSGAEITAMTEKMGTGFDITTDGTLNGPDFISAADGAYFQGGTSNIERLVNTDTSSTPVLLQDVAQTFITIFKLPASLTSNTLMRIWGYTNDTFTDFQLAYASNYQVFQATYNPSYSAMAIGTHLYNNSGADPASAQGGQSLDTWYMLTGKIVNTGSTMSYYFQTSMNGAPFSATKTFNTSYRNRTEDFVIGTRAGNTQNPFSGYLKHCIVYGAALTDANIADIYANYVANS